jgi:hypothetical protein
MKRITKTIIISAILILLIVLVLLNISGLDSDNSNSSLEYTHSWTKAICNETHCQDYEIYCKNDEFVRQSPITGAVISIPKGWEDPRNETMREMVCE